jgi:hypothetical protein
MRKRWVYLDGVAHEVNPDYRQDPVSPMVMPDIQPYQSMADGTWITSRSHHRAHLKQHRMIEIGNETKYLRPKEVNPHKGLKDTLIRVANEKLR